MSPAPRSLERKLGYTFTQPALLAQALTHRSFGTPHNERLEFLGDSILNCTVALLIYERYAAMPEGELSRLRANLVNQAVLAEIAAQLEIGPLLKLGEGEVKTGGADRPSILADAVEALLGAVFVDTGFDAVRDVVQRLFDTRLDSVATPTKDAKTALQEWLQAKHQALPQYSVTRIAGAAHKQTFQVHCMVGEPSDADHVFAVGEGASRRSAEQHAAKQVLDALEAARLGTTTKKAKVK
jgi:ribonuclease III